jgi:ubiquinone/menaquinone biosynthesis C-methylase UbiE
MESPRLVVVQAARLLFVDTRSGQCIYNPGRAEPNHQQEEIMTQPSGQPSSPMTPEQLMQMSMSYTASRILAAGVQLDVFAHVAAGRPTAAEIARASGASERGLRMLLDALAALQLLTKSGGGYQLTPASRQYLVPDSVDYMGAILKDNTLWEGWGHLDEAVRAGGAGRRVEDQAEAEKFFPVLVRSLHVMNREPARRTAEVLGAGKARRGLRVVDVACGSGVWGIGVAEADSTAHVTMQDFPGVLDHTREYVKRHGLGDRCDYLPGDLKKVDFGTDRYDVALLGNIVHSEGEASSRDLFRRLHRALRPGGQLVVIDMVPNDDRTGPPWPLIFALNMLIHTEVGDTYTLAEYTRWLNEAGFPRVETADIGSHSPLVIGVKG